MSIIDRVHGKFVHQRRASGLSDHLAELIPPGASVLDVGCGDGEVAELIMRRRRDISISGIDVLVRRKTGIPIAEFNGREIPYDNDSFDVVMFVDVLHHTDDPMALLKEAVRVARQSIIIKDHINDSLFDDFTLRFMDFVGNARFGVALTYSYWSSEKWDAAFKSLGLSPSFWKTNLNLYPPPATWVFDRGLHFIARLNIQNDTAGFYNRR